MGTKAKISGSVVAGFPSPAEQYLEPPLDLNELLVKRPAATYFVRVEGDSMSGAGISDGDLLVVDRSLRPADGDVIIASVDGDSPRRGRHPARAGEPRLSGDPPPRRAGARLLRQGHGLHPSVRRQEKVIHTNGGEYGKICTAGEYVPFRRMKAARRCA